MTPHQLEQISWVVIVDTLKKHFNTLDKNQWMLLSVFGNFSKSLLTLSYQLCRWLGVTQYFGRGSKFDCDFGQLSVDKTLCGPILQKVITSQIDKIGEDIKLTEPYENFNPKDRLMNPLQLVFANHQLTTEVFNLEIWLSTFSVMAIQVPDNRSMGL